jgi:hypothetical protein
MVTDPIMRSMHFMDRVEHVIGGNLSFPLERINNSSWARSETHQVTVTTEQEMALVALIVLDNFLMGINTNIVSFRQWAQHFPVGIS